MAICGWIPPRPWGTLMGIELLAVAVCKSTLTVGFPGMLDEVLAVARVADVPDFLEEAVDVEVFVVDVEDDVDESD